MSEKLDKANNVNPEDHRPQWGRRRRWRKKCATGYGHGCPYRGPAVLTELPLSGVHPGSTVVVRRLLGDEAFRGRMIAMGIVPGTSLSVLQAGGSRPLLVALPGSRFVLDWTSARSIMVSQPRARQFEVPG